MSSSGNRQNEAASGIAVACKQKRKKFAGTCMSTSSPDLAAQANPFKQHSKRRKSVNQSSLPLPEDKLAEQTILGTLICEPSVFFEACQDLRADDFAYDPHRRIYRALLALFGDNEPIELLPLMQQLQSTGELQTIGGVSYLSDLVTNEMPSPSHIKHQVDRLVDLRRKREVIVICNDVAATAHDWDVNSDECISKLNMEAMSLAADHAEGNGVKLGELIQPTLAEWRQRAKTATGRAAIGMTFGLPSVDRATSGMWEKELTLLGGHTKDCKTATAIAIIIANLKEGVSVFYASHEMNREQVYARIVSQEAAVEFSRLRDPRNMTPRDWAAVEAANTYIQKWPLYIDDAPMLDISKLVALGRFHARQNACKLVVVDYLQRVNGPGDKRHEVVSNVSRALCGLAKEEKVHVLALSQLTNPMDRDRNKIKPNLRMFRDSGDPVQDANVVMAVWRPEKDGCYTGEDQILVLAQRSGAGGLFIDVEFDAARLCYIERSARKEAEPQKGLKYDDWNGPSYAAH